MRYASVGCVVSTFISRGGVCVQTGVRASTSPSQDIVRLLLRAGASPHLIKRKTGFTALFWAAEKGFAEVCTLLLAAGARADLRTAARGETPAELARKKGFEEVARQLEAAAAVAAVPTATGQSYVGMCE